ncbi:MAG: SHOCT domain-containing protein [Chloroflexi bacterium]|nr:SHOCT domain-containing protein [Chloroflexota bacterium]
MMWGPSGSFGWGGMIFGGIFMILFWVAAIALTVWVVRLIIRHDQPRHEAGGQSPLDIAKARYARGEITKEQFEQLKRDLM